MRRFTITLMYEVFVEDDGPQIEEIEEEVKDNLPEEFDIYDEFNNVDNTARRQELTILEFE